MNEQDLAQIQRRQRIAEMLMSQGQEPINANRMAGGYVVPVQPLEAVSKIAQQLTGAYLGKKASDRYASLAQQDRDALANLDLSSPDAEKILIGQGRIAEALALRRSNRANQVDPYYTFQPTRDGRIAVGNNRSGELAYASIGGEPVYSASQDPITQGNLTAAKEGAKGVTYEDQEGRKVFDTQGNASQGRVGLRNNPGNIRPIGSSKGFQSYDSPESGIQAIYNNLEAYANKHGINTIEGVISRWSPPNENDTQALIANASKRLGIAPNATIDLTDPVQRHAVATAIMMQENPIFKNKGRGPSIKEKESMKQAAKIEAEQDLAPIKADAEKQKALAKEQAAFMTAFPERMNALEKTKTIIDNAILALDVQKDKKGNVTGYGLETGGKVPALQQWYYQDVMNDPARRALDMAAAKEQLQGAIEYLKGQGQVTEGEREIVALLSGIDPYKYDSATNYKYLKQAQDLLVNQLDSLKRRASGDFSTSGYELKREAPKQENKVKTKRKMTEAEIEELRQLEAEFGGM